MGHVQSTAIPEDDTEISNDDLRKHLMSQLVLVLLGFLAANSWGQFFAHLFNYISTKEKWQVTMWVTMALVVTTTLTILTAFQYNGDPTDDPF